MQDMRNQFGKLFEYLQKLKGGPLIQTLQYYYEILMISYTQWQNISRYFSYLIELMAFNNPVSYFGSKEYKYKK